MKLRPLSPLRYVEEFSVSNFIGIVDAAESSERQPEPRRAR